MIIQWKLENPKFCDGCPCFDGFIECKYFSILMKDNNDEETGKTLRPHKCLEKNSI